ncbi:hypothetical protein A8990_14147 [Paenibacillus taihuensis]|uniref:Uncharacterized protein n=1 Tax=Paenibacillus taihuensis TaxID=1156355 RepID=A0A3D9QV09_9BACL|nr:hypothetical protein [Paenibacillus taihuensis]REE67686.1 hypothetical protein A8990_14147 [Paenibacillus taihuensis]
MRFMRYFYPGLVVLMVILYLAHLIQLHERTKQQASDLLHDVRSYADGVRDTFERAPVEPTIQQYGQIREGTGMLIGFNKAHSSPDLKDVTRLTDELVHELFSVILQNKFDEDRAYLIAQLKEAYQGMPETVSQIDAASLKKLTAKLHQQHIKYMYKKYHSYG